MSIEEIITVLDTISTTITILVQYNSLGLSLRHQLASRNSDFLRTMKGWKERHGEIIATAVIFVLCLSLNFRSIDLKAPKRCEEEVPVLLADKSNFCSLIPPGRSASSLWMDNRQTIIDATAMHHPKDPHHVHKRWIEELFDTLSPTYMEGALSVFPQTTDLNLITSVLDTVMQNANASRPLEVLVLGGSVPQGRGCEVLPKEIQHLVNSSTAPDMKGQACSWVFRLQLLANAFLGPNYIHVINNAVGGTSTKLSIPILEFGLFADRKTDPDVVINSFATNDALYSWSNNETLNNASSTYDHFHKTTEMAQEFIRASMAHRQRAVMFVDAYLGNQHNLLLAEDIRADAVRAVSQQTGASVVRTTLMPFVYADTSETLVSPKWTYKRKPSRDAHYGMPGHQAVAWMVGYSALKSMVEYCAVEAKEDKKAKSVPKQKETRGTTSKNPCTFAFLANPAGTHRKASHLGAYLRSHTIQKKGWQAEDDIRNGWQNKLGLVSHEAGSEIIFAFNNITEPIRHLTVHSLQSYGEMWEGSEASFTVAVDGEERGNLTILGYHDDTTSISVPSFLDMGEKHQASIGQNVTLRIKLVNGTNFKINSLLLCSR